MSTLKELRNRIRNVRSTQKITSAMKMVAVAKLRRAEDSVKAARPFSLGLGTMVQRLISHGMEETSPFLGNSTESMRLLIIVTSDRGLCGAFNANLMRTVRTLLREWQREGIPFKIACLGRKGRDILHRSFPITFELTNLSSAPLTWKRAEEISLTLQGLIKTHFFHTVEVVYSRFRSALVQRVTHQCLVPYAPLNAGTHVQETYYDILEPSPKDLFNDILAENFTAQIYRILLESLASEHGARMTAMDNATRNAKDVISELQLDYNRTRQALITKELIEVISGAEAL